MEHIGEINTELREGRLLLAALARLTSEVDTDKDPDTVLKGLVELSKKMNPDIIEVQIRGEAATRKVWLNGEELDPKPSQAKYNHSPDGFSWGYAGSGPAQLALAICMKLGIDDYQEFKHRYIATAPVDTDFLMNIWIDKSDV